jgi:hypothetical protein
MTCIPAFADIASMRATALYKAERLPWQTPEGIAVKPVYGLRGSRASTFSTGRRALHPFAAPTPPCMCSGHGPSANIPASSTAEDLERLIA